MQLRFYPLTAMSFVTKLNLFRHSKMHDQRLAMQYACPVEVVDELTRRQHVELASATSDDRI